jgi:polyphosphate kinase
VAEISEQFDIAFDKRTAAWKLQPDGSWIAFTTDAEGRPLLDMQEYLINATSRRRAGPK